ncbi:MAG: Jag N-terminal domain-containing protein [Clostridia bacterium]|nr:Jag N-terminal domain-containing protein [Clostridia bacterium]
MIKEVIASGKDVSEAKELARTLLGADELADVQYEILHAGSKGIFGVIGVKPAKVRAYIELPDDAPRREPQRDRQFRENRPERQNRPERNNQPRQHNGQGQRRGRNEERIPRENPNPQPPKKRSEVIPEDQVKLEKIEAAPGEDRSLDFVNTLIANLGLDATATLYSTSDGARRIVIAGEGAASLIGHHGDTLDSLQYLANLACAQLNSKGERDHSRVTIDVEGYRAKREEALRAVARRMAEKAKRTRRNVMLEPMSPYERRIIHDEVSGIEGVTTSSVGSDNNRRVVIFFERRPADAARAKETYEEPVPETVTEPEIEEESEIEVEIETEIGTEEGTDVSSVSDDGIDSTENESSEEENSDGDPA